MPKQVGATRSRSKDASKRDWDDKENSSLASTRTLRSGKKMLEKPALHNNKGIFCSTPNKSQLNPPDITLTTPAKTSDEGREKCMFPRQYLARPNLQRGQHLLTFNNKKKKKLKERPTDDTKGNRFTSKTKKVVKETPDFFGIVEASSTSPSPSPPPVPSTSSSSSSRPTKGERSRKRPVALEKTVERGRKVKKDACSAEFERWMKEFNSELDEVEDFELNIMKKNG